MRYESFTTISGLTLINDTHPSGPESFKAGLAHLENEGKGRVKVAVIEEDMETPPWTEAEVGSVASKLRAGAIDHLIIVGHGAGPLAVAMEERTKNGLKISRVGERPDAGELATLTGPAPMILYRGMNRSPLDEVARDLADSIGPTRLIVDLDAIKANIRSVRSTISDDVGIMAVVKSFGYGHDSVAASRVAIENGVEHLAVAIPDEGIFLRRNNIDANILVFNIYPPDEWEKLLKHDLAATITSIEMARLLNSVSVGNDRIKVHLKIDTGMGRSGVWHEKAPAFVKDTLALENLEVIGIMTHLSSADMPDQDEYTMKQIDSFHRLLDDLGSQGIEFRYVHAANTAGIARFPSSHFNMVRPGLGLYGMSPSEVVEESLPLARVIKFSSKITQIKDHPAGRSVSYGRRFITQKESRIATLPVGYNDGYPRFQTNTGEVLIRGQRAPVVGAVCMDAIMTDITHIPDAMIGDEAILIGGWGDNRISVDEIARNGGTINYEIACKISPRVPRVFFKS